jgi:hypothetical protein
VSNLTDLVAQPGDPDLDLDIDNVAIESVVRLGYEFMIRISGGFGRWVSDDGTEAVFEPGNPKSGVKSGNLDFGMPSASEQLLVEYEKRFDRWYAQATPLRLCGAPGRMFTLIEDSSSWVPLPRGDI